MEVMGGGSCILWRSAWKTGCWEGEKCIEGLLIGGAIALLYTRKRASGLKRGSRVMCNGIAGFRRVRYWKLGMMKSTYFTLMIRAGVRSIARSDFRPGERIKFCAVEKWECRR